MSQHTFNITAQEFTPQVLSSDLPVLVEFTADWCPPCKMLAPIIDQIAVKYDGKLRVGLLDTDLNPDVTVRYGVMGMPTLILFVGGTPVERIIGFTRREAIEARLLPHLAVENA